LVDCEVFVWHLTGVKAAAPSTRAQDFSSPLSVTRFLGGWIETVNDYLQRQYKEVIQQEPSSEKLSQFRLECKWLLRSGLEIESMVKDPEYPAPQFGPEIAGKLLQLKESWETLNNPMTDAEADAILQKIFPDDSRTGSAS
jgi:hypothetical protein